MIIDTPLKFNNLEEYISIPHLTNTQKKSIGYYVDNTIHIHLDYFINFIKCNNTINGNICKLGGNKCAYLRTRLLRRSENKFIIPHHCPLIHNRNLHKNFDLILSYEYYEKYKTKQYTI